MHPCDETGVSALGNKQSRTIGNVSKTKQVAVFLRRSKAPNWALAPVIIVFTVQTRRKQVVVAPQMN